MDYAKYWASATSTADLGEEIAQSLRFTSSGYLTRAQSAPLLSDDRTFTFSTWFKHGDMGETQIFGIHQATSDNWLVAWTPGASYDTFLSRDYTGWQQYDSTQKFRDPNAWYHIFLTCSSGVMTMKVNNVARGGTVTQNHSMDRDFVLGAENNGGSTPMDAYLAETYFIQGTVLHPVNDGFIRLNADGVYVPDTPTISSYGTNGWHLTYDSSQTNGIGHDSSGNGNHFTASGFDTTAISGSNFENDIDYEDTPTKNYCTLNPLDVNVISEANVAEGNLTAGTSTAANQVSLRSTHFQSSGKWYFEVENPAAAGTNIQAGWATHTAVHRFESSHTGVHTRTLDENSVTMVAADFDNNAIWFGKDGTWDNSATQAEIEAGNTANASVTSVGNYPQSPAFIDQAGSFSGTANFNFGQRNFVYTVPSGFQALNTDQITEPTIKNGKEHFDAILYTGNSSTNTITGLEFQPDFVWIKQRNATENHFLTDSVRGAGVHLRSDSTNAEQDLSATFTGFTSDGFNLTGDISGAAQINDNTDTYVAWCWKAGGAPTVDNDNAAGVAQDAGSVKVDGSDSSFAQGTIAVKKMSVNTTAGFSIVEYTGTGSAGTIPHGLGAVPGWAIFKRTDGTAAWNCYHDAIGNTSKVNLNDNFDAATASTTFWNNTSPTSTLFTLGAGGDNNSSGENMIAYIWTPIEGYSKFGSYTGNGNADGPFVYTGFTPHFLLVRSSTAGGIASYNWCLIDTTREPNNPNGAPLHPNTTDAEQDFTSAIVDILSNGFKIRGSANQYNASSQTYIYIAFASNPFGGENQPPATAR